MFTGQLHRQLIKNISKKPLKDVLDLHIVDLQDKPNKIKLYCQSFYDREKTPIYAFDSFVETQKYRKILGLNPKYRVNNEIFDFLKSGRIFDEYGREFTFEEFINDEVGESLNTGYDLETYEKSNPSMNRSYYFYRREELERFREKYDQDVNEFGEFYIDDLRFTTSSEFS